MIELNLKNNTKRSNGINYLEFKSIEDSTNKEEVNLNDTETLFELSVVPPNWTSSENIIFFDYFDSLLRIKYKTSRNYKNIIEDLIKLEKFFKFCANRNEISFKKIFLETKSNIGEDKKRIKIFIPYMIKDESKKYVLNYNLLKNHLNSIFKIIDKLNYLFSIIPNNDSSFLYDSVSTKKYCTAFSCFESIYKYTHKNNDIGLIISNEEKKLEEIKQEILPYLKKLRERYKGNDAIKRNFIERFIHIISSSNLKLENCIENEIASNDFVIECLVYQLENQIKEYGIKQSIAKAVETRDNLTHNGIVALDDISIGIYEIVLKLNYIMILKYVGIDSNQIKKSIKELSLKNII